MAVQDIDFEGANNAGGDTNNDTKSAVLDSKDDVTHLNGGDVDDITNSSTDDDKNKPDDKDGNNNDQQNDDTSTGELNAGDQLEVVVFLP